MKTEVGSLESEGGRAKPTCTIKGRIEPGNQIWVFVIFRASWWLNKSGQTRRLIHYTEPPVFDDGGHKILL
jgi:hypothetical protein